MGRLFDSKQFRTDLQLSGSFSGSFEGSGANLTNIPASGIVGLNLSQIASGSATASISPINGLFINTNLTASNITASSIDAFEMNVTHFTASFITASTIQTSGSNIFGDESSDTHTFIGDIIAENNISSSGFISASNFVGDGSSLTGVDSIYTANGNILETRTINDRTGGFTGSAGSNALKINIRNSGALMVAGYQNNGDPGTANNCFRWGPGATNGLMNVRGNLALSGGGGAISLIASNGAQYTTISQTGVSITSTGTQEYIAPAIGFGTSATTNYRVRIKGATSTSSGYGLLVQNSSNDNILSIRDDGNIRVETAAPNISIQRTDNDNNASIDFIGQGGATGAQIQFSGSSNELTFGTYDGSSVIERLRIEDGTSPNIMMTGSLKVSGSLIVSESKGNFTFSGSNATMSFSDGQGLFGLDIINTVDSSTNTHGAKIQLTHVNEGATIYYQNGGGGGRFHDALNFNSDTGMVFEANAETGHGPFFDFFSDGGSNDQALRMFNTGGNPKGELRFFTNNGGTSNSMISLGQSGYGGYIRGGHTPNKLELGLTDYTSYSASMDMTLTSINLHSSVTSSTDISSSATSTASFGTYLGDGSKLTGIVTETNFTQSLFVSPSGDDATAAVGDMMKPFATILAATASANIGDTIIVYPGTYNDTNILKDGVNYYFYAGAKIQTSTDWILKGIGAFDYPINIRGAGKFENNDTNTGIGSITANAGGYIEFDEMKTDSINTAYVNSFTVKNDSTDESTLFIRGRMFDSGSNSNNAVFFNITGDNANLVDFEGEIISVKGSRICAQTRYSPGSDNIHLRGNFYCENNTCLDMDGRNNNIKIEGNVVTGDGANSYAIRCGGTGDDLYISANVNGAIYVGSGVTDSGAAGIVLEGRLGGSASPGNLGLLQIYGGNNIINSSIAANETIFYIAGGETIFNGHASLPSNYTDGRFFNITAGKLIFNGMGDSSGGNRNSQNLVSGGHLVIDSYLEYYGTTSPSVPFLTLSGGTLEINNTIRTRTNVAGMGIIKMTGGYLKLNGAQLVHATQTGSYGYAIDLNNQSHSGSIFNNSFTNLTPFGNTGSFTNEILGGGTLFESHKLY